MCNRYRLKARPDEPGLLIATPEPGPGSGGLSSPDRDEGLFG